MTVQTRRTWANDIATSPKYSALRNRIYLREELGREPTEAEILAAVDTESRFKKKDRLPPSMEQLDQIIRAYSDGDEVI